MVKWVDCKSKHCAATLIVDHLRLSLATAFCILSCNWLRGHRNNDCGIKNNCQDIFLLIIHKKTPATFLPLQISPPPQSKLTKRKEAKNHTLLCIRPPCQEPNLKFQYYSSHPSEITVPDIPQKHKVTIKQLRGAVQKKSFAREGGGACSLRKCGGKSLLRM